MDRDGYLTGSISCCSGMDKSNGKKRRPIWKCQLTCTQNCSGPMPASILHILRSHARHLSTPSSCRTAWLANQWSVPFQRYSPRHLSSSASPPKTLVRIFCRPRLQRNPLQFTNADTFGGKIDFIVMPESLQNRFCSSTSCEQNL
jgi:hypothetical protein